MTSRDRRDEAIERAWRDASRDEPPRHLDDAILARAREAVAPRVEEAPSELWPLAHPRSWFMRWRVPLAVAATLVVSATVTLLVYDSGMEEPPPVVTDRPLRKAPPPAPPAPSGAVIEKESAAAPSAQPALSGTVAEKQPASAPPPAPPPAKPSADVVPPAPSATREAQPVERKRAQPEAASTTQPSAESGRAPAPPDVAPGRAGTPEPRRAEEALGASREAPAAAPAPTAAPVPERAPAAAGAVAPTAPRAAPAPMAAPPPPAAPTTAPPVPQAAPRDNAVREKRDESLQAAPGTRARAAALATPEAYVERIRELKRAGREAEARELLEELKRRFPAFELPDDLKLAR
jgi:hypothetical protein